MARRAKQTEIADFEADHLSPFPSDASDEPSPMERSVAFHSALNELPPVAPSVSAPPPPDQSTERGRLVPSIGAVICRAYERFARALPPGALTGSYTVTGDDGFYGNVTAVPDGTYRVCGADWLIVVHAGRIAEFVRAMPPDFGGPDVIRVPNA